MLGHELMHVYNRDILTSSVAAAVAGVITSIAQIAPVLRRASAAATTTTGPTRSRCSLIALAAPLAATVIQLAISRTREYDADEDGAR